MKWERMWVLDLGRPRFKFWLCVKTQFSSSQLRLELAPTSYGHNRDSIEIMPVMYFSLLGIPLIIYPLLILILPQTKVSTDVA